MTRTSARIILACGKIAAEEYAHTREVKHLRLTYEKRLGVLDPKKIEIKGEGPRQRNYRV